MLRAGCIVRVCSGLAAVGSESYEYDQTTCLLPGGIRAKTIGLVLYWTLSAVAIWFLSPSAALGRTSFRFHDRTVRSEEAEYSTFLWTTRSVTPEEGPGYLGEGEGASARFGGTLIRILRHPSL